MSPTQFQRSLTWFFLCENQAIRFDSVKTKPLTLFTSSLRRLRGPVKVGAGSAPRCLCLHTDQHRRLQHGIASFGTSIVAVVYRGVFWARHARHNLVSNAHGLLCRSRHAWDDRGRSVPRRILHHQLLVCQGGASDKMRVLVLCRDPVRSVCRHAHPDQGVSRVLMRFFK